MATATDGGCVYVYLAGDQSGVGKSSIAIALFSLLLSDASSSGWVASDLAYIKPSTQCTDVQLVTKFCVEQGIACEPLGPIVFYQGYTKECIDGTAPDTTAQRLDTIRRAVAKIAVGKKFVLIDGVGYPAVGSVCGVSNADVAKALGAPVLLVGRPGLGNAIDAMNYMHVFFQYHHVHVLGAIWNKLPAQSTYHPFDECRTYVAKYFHQHSPSFGVYGFVPLVEMSKREEPSALTPSSSSSSKDAPTTDLISCGMRAPKTSTQFEDDEREYLARFLTVAAAHIDIRAIVRDAQAWCRAAATAAS